ncbi:MAG: ECF-type sigma factor [Acidobacteriota bacterium]
MTRLLDRWSAGDTDALGRLMPLIVRDLRNMAGKQLAAEGPGHTLQPTALVNEVYLRLAGRRTVQWDNRQQFFAFVAGMMRRVLVDHARRQRAEKRGGDAVKMPLDEAFRLPGRGNVQVLDLDLALRGLTEIDPRQARIVELRFFVGLSVEEVAAVEGISRTTVKREWHTAKLWLLRQIHGS